MCIYLGFPKMKCPQKYSFKENHKKCMNIIIWSFSGFICLENCNLCSWCELDLIFAGDRAPKVTQCDSRSRLMVSPPPDSEALIVVEVEMFNSNSPSNSNPDGPLHVVNFQFNNLDIIGKCLGIIMKHRFAW